MAKKETAKDRFKAICAFERKNDPFIWSIDSWYESFQRWVKEGMPVRNMDNKIEANMYLIGPDDENEGIKPNAIIYGLGKCHNPPWIVAVDPMFEPEIISEDETHIVERDYDGTIVRRRKSSDDTIPQYLEYPVKDKKTWEKFKERLDPFSPGRWPQDWEIMSQDTLEWPVREEVDGKHFKDRDFPLGMLTLSLYGNIRNYMGLENLSIAIYDNPSLVLEMMDWQVYMATEMLKKVYETGTTMEWVWIWEDMAFNKGSLVSPEFVKKQMVPRYKPVTQLLRDNGCDALILDCDGNCEELIPLWIESGINGLYPLERAAGMDGLKLRKQYGRDLILIGNIDKRELSKGKKEIDRQLEEVKELLKYGGYLPNCDHHIPPDVPYKNLVYLINEIRKMDAWTDNPRQIEIVDPLV
jgi:hypothetical protein